MTTTTSPPHAVYVKALIVIAIVGVVSYLLFVSAPDRGGRSAPSNALRVASEHLSFSAVATASTVSVALPIHNTTSRVIRIRRFLASCACTSVEPASLSIPPNGTGTVTVEVRLTPGTVAKASQHLRHVTVDVVPEIDGDSEVHEKWRIVGRVSAPVVLSQSRVVLLVDRAGASDAPAFRLKCAVSVPANAIRVSGIEDIADVVVRPGDESGRDFDVVLVAKPHGRETRVARVATIAAVNESGEEIGIATCEVDLRVRGDCIALPGSIVFRFDSESRQSREIIIMSRSGQRLRLVEILLPLPKGVFVNIGQPSGDRCRIVCEKTAVDEPRVARETLQLSVTSEGASSADVIAVPVFSLGRGASRGAE